MLGGIFHFYSSFNRKLCKQTVETLVRRRILWRLIWVCTICLCPTKWSRGQISNFEFCCIPQEEKGGYYFQSGTCLGASETHVLLSFLWSIFCKWPVITVTPQTLKIAVHKNTRLIIYFILVSMNLFEIKMFTIVININCRHL